jgi:hypothetical protein
MILLCMAVVCGAKDGIFITYFPVTPILSELG